jgi:hypothetical protein
MKAYIWIVSRGEDGQTMAEYAVVLGVITRRIPLRMGDSASWLGMLGVKLCCGLQVAFE